MELPSSQRLKDLTENINNLDMSFLSSPMQRESIHLLDMLGFIPNNTSDQTW